MKFKVLKILFLFAILMAVMAFAVSASSPDGVTILTNSSPTTKPSNLALNVTADGGNITSVNLEAETQTTAWQGFFGQVTGNLTLRDSSLNQLYSWQVATPTGEVLVSTNNSIDFSTFAMHQECVVDESITGTGTDRVNNTFNNTTSVVLEIGGTTFTDGCTTNTYTNSVAQSSVFPEYIGNATEVNSIWVTAINESTTGFDGTSIDYQMIVPAAVGGTTYSFFIEFD